MAPRRRERWYSIEGQRRNHESAKQSSHGPRRLISLVILLVLTLMMIQQVSDPRRVAKVAGAVGLLPNETIASPLTQSSTGSIANGVADSGRPSASGPPEMLSIWKLANGKSSNPNIKANENSGELENSVEHFGDGPTDEQLQDLFLFHGDPAIQLQSEILESLLVSSSSGLLFQLCRSEFGASAKVKSSSTSSLEAGAGDSKSQLDTVHGDVGAEWFQSAQSKLTRWIELSDSKSLEHGILVELSRTFERWGELRDDSNGSGASGDGGASSMAAPTADSMSRFQRAFQLALDRRLLYTFSDNTPWKSNERWPLTRTTQRAVALHEAIKAGWILPEMVPSTSIPQLVSLTDELRGKGVRISGTIKLVDREAEVGVSGGQEITYGVVWLQPDDLSNQPVVVHVPDAIHSPHTLMAKDTPVTVTGLLTKRRAYASARGGEIAPVIVAADLRSPMLAGTPAPTLSSLQQSIAKAIASPTSGSWQPPIDYEGPKQLIVEKLGSRLDTIVAMSRSSDATDLSRVRDYAVSENTIGILLGLERFQEEIEILTQRGPVSLPPMEPSDHQPSHPQKRLRRIQGIVRSVVPVPIEQPPFPGLEWKQLYAVTVLSPPSQFDAAMAANDVSEGSTTIAITKEVPSYWLQSNAIGQPCELIGLLLTPVVDLPANAPHTMLCSGLRWCESESVAFHDFSVKESGSLGGSSAVQGNGRDQRLPLGWQMLLQRGWDLSWLDRLESLQGQSMTSKESKAFYTMIAASRVPSQVSKPTEVSPSGLEAPNKALDEVSSANPSEQLAMMPLIRRAEGTKKRRGVPTEALHSVGLRTQATVQVRRVQRIEVDDPRWQPILGSTHYFQIDGLADIGRNKIEINYGEGNEPVVFQREFPITLVAATVPSWLLVDSGDADPSSSQSWYPRMRTDVEGWFYRMWKYKTTQVSIATNDTQFQQGPMVVVDRIELGKPLDATNSNPRATTSWSTIVTTLAGFAIIGWIAWKLQRHQLSKRQHEAHAKSRR
ncbi:MAG: hypothetical protein FJ308_01605 [Planctomycetes bacterium]|nr:hypothetical protein [Planctomycetota bacterium]